MTAPWSSLTPRVLTSVWATALRQLVELAQRSLMGAIEVLSSETPIGPIGESQVISVARTASGDRHLEVAELQGETFHEVVTGDLVTFDPGRTVPSGIGTQQITCSLPVTILVRGDVYRGEVVDDTGHKVAELALRGGS